MTNPSYARQTQTLVIGGGQAGLAVGYYLAKRGLPFQILDAHPRVGDAWRNRWDSLRLFTPARYAGLPGSPFPGRGDAFPTKQQVADYLESYAQHFHLPVQTGVKVDRLWKEDDRFLATAGPVRFEAEQVVVAMANYQVPRLPSFAGELDPAIRQLHSKSYRNPSQLLPGGVLVVGAGNSAADIALEVAKTHSTWMSGKESGHIPVPIDGVFGRYILSRIVRFVGHHVLSLATPIGRKARPKQLSRTTPLIRVKPKDLVNAGVERVDRVVGVRDGRPLLADGRVFDVSNVIWCTGFEPGFSWIDLPIFDDHRQPLHDRGITRVPGMYFVGLHFLYAMSSATLIGVGRDAEYVVKAIHQQAQGRSVQSAAGRADVRGTRATIAIAS
jgi:putative flavoprotein involved in K+ transport